MTQTHIRAFAQGTEPRYGKDTFRSSYSRHHDGEFVAVHDAETSGASSRGYSEDFR